MHFRWMRTKRERVDQVVKERDVELKDATVRLRDVLGIAGALGGLVWASALAFSTLTHHTKDIAETKSEVSAVKSRQDKMDGKLEAIYGVVVEGRRRSEVILEAQRAADPQAPGQVAE